MGVGYFLPERLQGGWKNMFHSDRHFPTSFLSGNPSLRDMVKDKGDFDRRLDDINKRQVERRQRQDKQDDERSSSTRMASSNGGSSVGPRLYYQQPYNSRAFKQDYSLISDRSNTRLQVPSSPRASPMRQTTGGGIEWPSYRPSSGNRSTDSYVGILNSPALNGSSLD